MTKNKTAPVLSSSKILAGAVFSGVINGLINGAIQWYLLRGRVSIPLSVDAISNDEHLACDRRGCSGRHCRDCGVSGELHDYPRESFERLMVMRCMYGL